MRSSGRSTCSRINRRENSSRRIRRMRTAGKLPYTCMIAPFLQADQSLIFLRIRDGNLSAADDSHTVGDFGRLPLLLPERDALNLKAFCPGLISPFGPGAFISPPPVLPGVFICFSTKGHAGGPWRARVEPPEQHRCGFLEPGFLEAREQLH